MPLPLRLPQLSTTLVASAQLGFQGRPHKFDRLIVRELELTDALNEPQSRTLPLAFPGVAVGGDRNGGQEPTLQALNDFFVLSKMLPVGGGSFGANLGAAVWSRDKGIEGAKADDEGLKALRRSVDCLVDVAALVQESVVSRRSSE